VFAKEVKASSMWAVSSRRRTCLPRLMSWRLQPSLRGDIEAREGAETHAVHAEEIGEVEDDALVIRQQRPDLVVEYVADTGHEFAVQSDYDRVRVAIDVQRQGGRDVGIVGHG
jgi:hypothetical protein